MIPARASLDLREIANALTGIGLLLPPAWDVVPRLLAEFRGHQHSWRPQPNRQFCLACLEECVTNLVRGIGGRVADVPERTGAEAFGQLGEIETLRRYRLALRFDDA